MSVVDYPETSIGFPTISRIGGFYEHLEAAEEAAELLNMDVLIPPKSSYGWYLVPAPKNYKAAA